MRKNLIIVVIKDHSFNQIKSFFESLKKIKYEGDIKVCTIGINDFIIEKLRDYGCQIHKFREIDINLPLLNKHLRIHNHRYSFNIYDYIFLILKFTSYIPLSDIRLSVQCRISRHYHNIYLSRFLIQYLVLSKCFQHYSYVMLSDVRDVIFQGDPFDFEIGDNICCFLEDKSKTIGSCPHNSRWINEAYGDDVLNELYNNYISCSGITIGSSLTIMHYLKNMVLEIINLRVRLPGIDQALHNFIINYNIKDEVNLYNNDESPVLTIGYLSRNIEFNKEGFIENRDGTIPSVLHQYDRCSYNVIQKMLTNLC